MTLPLLLFGFLLSTVYGAAFHFWRGGRAGRLLLYLILSWGGFWIGHAVADRLSMQFGKLGSLQVLAASLGSLVVLGIGYWLSLVEVSKE